MKLFVNSMNGECANYPKKKGKKKKCRLAVIYQLQSLQALFTYSFCDTVWPIKRYLLFRQYIMKYVAINCVVSSFYDENFCFVVQKFICRRYGIWYWAKVF